jgi:copper transport protein
VVFACVLLLALWPGGASAHAFLSQTTPEANAVLPEPPGLVQLFFTEPIEKDYSKAELYDSAGNKVDTPASRIGPDPNQLTLQLPATMARGTYTVVWRNISAADGHPQSGYLPFTIGSQADVVTPTTPKLTQFNAPPTWLSATGRWLSLLGAGGAAGMLLCWLWVIQPALRADDPALDEDGNDARYLRVQSRMYRLGLTLIGVALLGSLLALITQTQNTGGAVTLGHLFDVATSTRFGYYWMLRIVLLLALATAYNSPTIWDDPPPWPVALSALGVAGACLVPFALVSHAAAQPVGEQAAVAADWLHLVGAATWIGGLLALLGGLVYGLRGSPGNGRRAVYAVAIPRFSTLAIASVLLLTLTGFYSAWLEVGNLSALRHSDYGHALLIKLGLMLPMLLLGALNLRVVGPRMRTAARAGVDFGRTLAAEAMLGVGILFAVGILTTLPTAREALTANAGQTDYHWAQGGLHVALYIAPGATGPNTYTVDAATDTSGLPADSQLLLRFTSTGNIEGTREVVLQPTGGVRYAASGSELSVVGDWQLELIVRRPNTEDWRVTQTLKIAQTPPSANVPSPPPRFAGGSAMLAVLFAGIALVTMIVAARHGVSRHERRHFAGIGGALALTAAVILLSAHATGAAAGGLAQNPVPLTAASVAAGQPLFQANCVSCHGVDGTGNGPNAPNLKTPPADLTSPHVDTHTDTDLQYWIENGLGSEMPSFKDTLSVRQMWDVVNYVRSLRHPVVGVTP